MFVNIFVDYPEGEYEKKAIETAEAIRKITPYTVMVTHTGRPLRVRRPDNSTVTQYRKKPLTIEAREAEHEEIIHTLEGDMRAQKGDYTITGVNGEQYPCKPDIFHKTYDKVQGA